MDENALADGQVETVFLIDDHTAWRRVGDESVVLDLENSVYFGLNRTAGALWQRLTTGATHAELTALLAADAGGRASTTQLTADVDAFLASLRDRGLVIESRP